MKVAFLLAAMTVPTAFATAVCAGDWPHWRGPDRNDRVEENSGWDARAWPPKEADIFATDVWPHVVLADGKLFCKDRQGNLKCFSVRPRGGAD
jgi:hypothetical protein